jgi:hypothetical protein
LSTGSSPACPVSSPCASLAPRLILTDSWLLCECER